MRNISVLTHATYHSFDIPQKNAFYQDNRISRRCIYFQHFFLVMALPVLYTRKNFTGCVHNWVFDWLRLRACQSFAVWQPKEGFPFLFFLRALRWGASLYFTSFFARVAHIFFGSFGTVRQRRLHVCQNRSPQCKVIFVSPLASMSSSAVRVFAKITTQQNLI